MAVVRGVAILVLFAVAIVVCNAGPTNPKEPAQPTVHVYAVPTFSVKPTSPGENRHYIVKEGTNITLTCETSFTSKNVLIDWVHPKAENEYEEKQIHSRHDGMNIKERILHIINARAEDSGSYTCHTRSLQQTTWGSPNTFYIQVGKEKKENNVDVNKKRLRPNTQIADTPTVRTNTSTTAKSSTSTTTTTTSTQRTSPVVTTTTTTSTTLRPLTTTTASTNTTQGPPPAPSQFDVASFLGGMVLVVGILLLFKLIHLAIKKYRQRNYGYQNM